MNFQHCLGISSASYSAGGIRTHVVAVAWDQRRWRLASVAASFNSVTSGLVGESWLRTVISDGRCGSPPYLG